MAGRGRRGKSYTPEFREQAVKLVRESGRSVVQVARQIGVSETALYRWVERASPGSEAESGEEPPLTSTERDELRRLRRELKLAQEENEFLKKASAFFAAESDRSRRNQNSG